MKFLKGLLVFLLILVIIGGLGYIFWNYYYTPNMSNMGGMQPSTPSTTAQQPSTNQNMQDNMGGMTMTGNGSMTAQTPVSPNTGFSTVALQNKESLTQVVATINQALDLITMDPYSKLTVPDGTNEAAAQQSSQTTQGGGTVNIYPGGNSSVNVNPTSTGGAVTGTAPATAVPATSLSVNANFVYDQSKLEQLHRGIFKLAQGVMLLNQLNSNLTMQASLMESNPMTYQSYIDRYNTAMINKTKLNNAISMINDATDLVNVNPYASRNGYQYDVQVMDRMHRGIYKLAQGMVLASELDEDFTNQMAVAATTAQYLYSTGSMSGMNMPVKNAWSSLLSPSNLAFAFNLILVVLIVTLILGIFGAVGQMFKSKRHMKENEAHNDNANF